MILGMAFITEMPGTASGMMAVAVDAGAILTAVIIFVASQVLSGVIASRIAVSVTAVKYDALSKSLKELSDTVKHQADLSAAQGRQIAAVQLDRVECARQSAQTYVNHNEFVSLIGSQTRLEDAISRQFSDFRTHVDQQIASVHGRVTESQKTLAKIEGRLEQS